MHVTEVHRRGQWTIAEVVPGFENITSQPKLDIVTVPGLTDFDQHWQMYTDKNGIIGPDGNPIEYESIVHKAPDGELVAVIDSGFTLPQVPRSVSDAIYGRVQGAEWNTENEVWTIPCGQLLNISLKFGGVTFPIHPLDTSSSDFGITNSNGTTVCVGTFQPITTAFSLLGEYDLILGMGFRACAILPSAILLIRICEQFATRTPSLISAISSRVHRLTTPMVSSRCYP